MVATGDTLFSRRSNKAPTGCRWDRYDKCGTISYPSSSSFFPGGFFFFSVYWFGRRRRALGGPPEMGLGEKKMGKIRSLLTNGREGALVVWFLFSCDIHGKKTNANMYRMEGEENRYDVEYLFHLPAASLGPMPFSSPFCASTPSVDSQAGLHVDWESRTPSSWYIHSYQVSWSVIPSHNAAPNFFMGHYNRFPKQGMLRGCPERLYVDTHRWPYHETSFHESSCSCCVIETSRYAAPHLFAPCASASQVSVLQERLSSTSNTQSSTVATTTAVQ